MQEIAQTYVDRIPPSQTFKKERANELVHHHFYYILLNTLSNCLQNPAITTLNLELQNWNARNDKADTLKTIAANFHDDNERAQLWLNRRFLFMSNSSLDTRSVARYSGTWLSGMKHGKGRLELCEDGCTYYEGGFGLDRLNGYGVLWKGCEKWAGSWLDDEFRGGEGEMLADGKCQVERGECAVKKGCECSGNKLCKCKWKGSYGKIEKLIIVKIV